jgi:hypothetical protein
MYKPTVHVGMPAEVLQVQAGVHPELVVAQAEVLVVEGAVEEVARVVVVAAAVAIVAVAGLNAAAEASF